jgi:hypothetical protein
MISPKEALAQLERMSGLDFFPKGRDQTAALKELRLALESAHSVTIAEAAVSDIIGYCTESPKPAQLRRAVWELNEQIKTKTQHCSLCGGSGQETAWILVTYVGHGLLVRRKEIMPNMDSAKARVLGAQLPWIEGPGPGDNQQLVTSARPCSCRKAA